MFNENDIWRDKSNKVKNIGGIKMSKIVKNALEYVEQSKLGLLATVGDDKIPFIRPMAAYYNKGSELYFVTRKATNKVEHISKNENVTFYFQNEGQDFTQFKSVALSGSAEEVKDQTEFEEAILGIGKRWPKIFERIASGEFEDSTIYKIKSSLLKYADYSKTPKESLEILN